MVFRLCVLVLVCVALCAAADNEDIVLAPPSSKSSDLPEKLLVFIPGGNVSTQYYQMTMMAIQEASNLRLWVIVPSISSKLCIEVCALAAICTLQGIVDKVMQKAVAQGYTGGTAAPDAFLAGHSLGGVCADTLIQANMGKPEQYAGLVLMGSYVASYDVAGYKLPVLTIAGELDGGLARPAVTMLSLESSDAAAVAAGHPTGGPWQLTNKPVGVLPHMDHSSFCPGFHVPGDVYPPEASNATAMMLAGDNVASFLHLHTEQDTAVVTKAQQYLNATMAWSRELLAPVKQAIAMEVSADQTEASWCKVAQQAVAALGDKDKDRLNFLAAVYKNDEPNFEHTRVNYTTAADHSTVAVNISGHNAYYSDNALDFGDKCIVPAEEIGCKMASADRIATELQLPAGGHTPNMTCKDVNKHALEVATSLLSQNEAGKATLARWQKRGRPLFFEDDIYAPFNIGPLWISERISIVDNGTGLVVKSLALGPNALDSLIFPGTHYCKLLSPARIIDYMMIDSLKEKSGCLNV